MDGNPSWSSGLQLTSKDFLLILGKIGDMESKEAMFKAAIGGCEELWSEGHWCLSSPCWWAQVMKRAVKLRKEAFWAWLNEETPEAVDSYQKPEGLQPLH